MCYGLMRLLMLHTHTRENRPHLTRAEILGQEPHKALIKEYALALEFIDMGL